MSFYDYEKEKRELLTQRGFRIGNQDLETYFANYEGRWRIKTISKEDVVKTTDLYLLKKKLFAKDSIEPSINSTVLYDTFEYFAAPIQPFQVAATELDPYIARFVRAINEIGVKTSMSCDGWHLEQDIGVRQMTLWMRDRYSVLWLWLITEYVFGEKWVHSQSINSLMWRDKWQPDDSADLCHNRQCMMILQIESGHEQMIYNRIQADARYLENQRKPLLQIRDKWIDTFQNDAEVRTSLERMGFMEVRRKVRGVIEQDLKNLQVND